MLFVLRLYSLHMFGTKHTVMVRYKDLTENGGRKQQTFKDKLWTTLKKSEELLISSGQ